MKPLRLSLLALACGAGAWMWLARGEEAPAVRGAAGSRAAVAEAGAPNAQAAGGGTSAAAPARDERWREAERNTIFRLDTAGGLVLDEAVAQRLQHLADTLPPGGDPAQAEALVQAGLPEAQAGRARTLLRHYLTYDRAQAALLGEPRDAEDVASAQRKFQQLLALRREHLGGADAQALFGAEESATGARLLTLAGPPR